MNSGPSLGTAALGFIRGCSASSSLGILGIYLLQNLKGTFQKIHKCARQLLSSEGSITARQSGAIQRMLGQGIAVFCCLVWETLYPCEPSGPLLSTLESACKDKTRNWLWDSDPSAVSLLIGSEDIVVKSLFRTRKLPLGYFFLHFFVWNEFNQKNGHFITSFFLKVLIC